MRKELLVCNEIYHIFNKSIMDFKIFNNDFEYTRMMRVMEYYSTNKPTIKYSDFMQSSEHKKTSLAEDKIIQIIAYCLMPTHFHLVIKQLEPNGVSTFMRYVLNSYARYFNEKHRRKGPLWEGNFKNVHIKTDEHLLHLTRYVHLNPVTAYLVNEPGDWPYSSYRQFVGSCKNDYIICDYKGELKIDPVSYRGFIQNRIDYQRDLAKIKYATLE